MTADPSGEPPGGRLRPTSVGALTLWGVVGLVGGWVLHPLAERMRDTAPIVTWAQPLALLLVAVILGATAFLTWRTIHVHQQRLEPQQAVNRLVLARACALVGALVAGGYLGYALSWIGDPAELADDRMVRALLAATAAIAAAVAAMFLERACRVRGDDD